MANKFLISDTHFFHANALTFLTADGSRMRPFNNVDEVDQLMIDNWNSVVKPEDKVYHLGDVVINRKGFSKLYALNGKKVLIKGNHDIFKLSDYTTHFYDVRAFNKFENFVATHIPIHPQELGRFAGNVHGHLHNKFVLDQFGKPDVRYKNVCVEVTNYTPVELSVLENYFRLLK